MKIAIIGGGGAGLLAAWLLEERHEVALFEREPIVGGHAKTVFVGGEARTIAASPGFHFFSRRMYPRFLRLLDHLKVPLRDYEQTATFFDRASGRVLCLPPWGNGLARIRTLLGAGAAAKLRALNQVLQAVKPLLDSGPWSVTLADLIAPLKLPAGFAENFLAPFFAANWGIRNDRILGCSARATLAYAALHQPAPFRPARWTEIDGGMARYIEAFRAAAAKTRFSLGCGVRALRREADHWTVESEAGAEGGFDHVIFATNAPEAISALSGVAGSEALRDALGGFEYFETRTAIHRDSSFLPPDRRQWSVVNLTRESGFCAIHHWAGWREREPLFRSWITHYEARPRGVIAEFSYLHGLPDPAYFASQRRLAALQGRQGLHFTGVYTQGHDNHESALGSAIDAALRIDAESKARAAILGEADAREGPG